MSRTLTTTAILAAATDCFLGAGYRRIEPPNRGWDFTDARLFEDAWGIVLLLVYESWEDLVSGWTESQGALVELISRNVSRSDPKAWEGYLVLLTPGIRGSHGQDEWMRIRYNTKRVRKLVASGEDLESIADVRASLAVLLPLKTDETDFAFDSALGSIPDVLKDEHKIDPRVTGRLVEAFKDQRNLMQTLHQARKELT